MNPDVDKPLDFPSNPPALPRPEEVDYDALIIEDDEPVDNIFTEKQQRLLTHPLYASWDGGGEPFFTLANVGLFSAPGEPSLCPDVMVSRRVRAADDLHIRANRSYFVWVVGKVPEAVIEIISDRTGGETSHKMVRYAVIGIPHYIVFDPDNVLGHGVLRAFRLVGEDYQPADPAWLEELGLGLRLWQGMFEDHRNTWLRWCARDGSVIPTGEENAAAERELARVERERADKERERADKERERADKERERADKERQAKEEAERKAAELLQQLERLAKQLRSQEKKPDQE